MAQYIIDPELLIYIFDIIGVIACAVAGTLLAQHKGFDIAGCILVSMANAIGGGTIRDLLLDRHPLFWMIDLNYVIVITLTSLALQIFFHLYHKIDTAVKFFDAIGLAAFSVIGLKVALAQGAEPSIAVLMAVCTSIFGGLVRDVICNEIPLVLQKEIYITACIIGCCCYLIFNAIGLPSGLNDLITLGVIFTIRALAIIFDWHLPPIRLVD